METLEQMERIKIGETDVLLEDHGEGRGKVIIASGFYNSSYYWGSMGSSLREFLKGINSQYFADKFCSNTWEFNAKESVGNVRRFIREDMSYDLPWYKFMSAQKELREELKKLESCYSADQFINSLSSLHDNLICSDLDREDTREFLQIIEDTFACEPWNFIGQSATPEYKWYQRLHKDIQKKI